MVGFILINVLLENIAFIPNGVPLACHTHRDSVLLIVQSHLVTYLVTFYDKPGVLRDLWI